MERSRRPDAPGIARLALTTALAVMAVGACGESTPRAERDDRAEAASGAGTNDDCQSVHAGHATMMWTAELADEMTDAGCGWPYEPFLVPLEGGEDDPALDAEFAPHHYAELWASISGSGLGLCSVGTDGDDPSVGLAFGFTYLLGPPGCPGATPTGTLVVGEYGTEAQRDLAAHTATGAGTADVYVLGRWVLRVEGDAAVLGDALSGAGAQRVA